jgi:hypothetical protein
VSFFDAFLCKRGIIIGKFKDINSAIEKLKSINDRMKQIESFSFKSVSFIKEEEKLLKQGEELKNMLL